MSDESLKPLADPIDALALESAFAAALKFTLWEEGVRLANGDYGVVNNPRDPGALTKAGITQAVWSAWCASQGRATSAVTQASLPEIVAIYRRNYWEPGKCDRLAGIGRPKLALCQFDWAVNAGLARAWRYVQAAVAATIDGLIGPATLKAAAAMDETFTISRYCRLRAAHYHLRAKSPHADQALALLQAAGLTKVLPTPNESQREFLHGWLVRVQHVATAGGVQAFDPLYADGAWAAA